MHKRFMFLCLEKKSFQRQNTKHMLACCFLTVLNIFRWIILFNSWLRCQESSFLGNKKQGTGAEDRG